MRVNVYAEEMTDKIEIIGKEINGHTFTGLRFYLELPATVNGQQYQGPFMHRPGDDDSSAVTFWGKRDLRKMLRSALVMLDAHYGDIVADVARTEQLNDPTPLTGDEVEQKAYRDWVVYANSRNIAGVEEMRCFMAGWKAHQAKQADDDAAGSFEGYLKRVLGDEYTAITIAALHAYADTLSDDAMMELRSKLA